MLESYRFLKRNEKIEKQIEYACYFKNAKFEFKQGKIINIKNTNISVVEPHKYFISIKDKIIVVLYFNEDNIFLYNRCNKIEIKNLKTLLKKISEGKCNV